MWAPGAGTTVQFKAAGKVTVTDIMGHTRTLDTSDGTGELTLSGDVAYVHGSISSITVG